MGLPSKRQLHKHKRGVRKALDTLKAMDEIDLEPDLAEEDDGYPEKRMGKKKSEPENQTVNHQTQEGSQTDNTTGDSDKTAPGQTPPPETKTDEEGLTPGSDTILDSPTEANNQPVASVAEPTIDSPAKQNTTTDAPNPKGEEPDADKTENSEKDKTDTEDAGEQWVDEDTQKNKYLTFQIEKEDFGVEIKYVTEIIVILRITEVPDTPPYIRGIINLRGKVIPVMDVRCRFGLKPREYDDRTCIVVVSCDEIDVGLIVDTVNEVVDIPEKHVDPSPKTHAGIESSYIRGMGKIGKDVKILLNVEKVLYADR